MLLLLQVFGQKANNWIPPHRKRIISKPQMEKGKLRNKLIKICSVKTVNICTTFHGSPSNNCQDNKVNRMQSIYSMSTHISFSILQMHAHNPYIMSYQITFPKQISFPQQVPYFFIFYFLPTSLFSMSFVGVQPPLIITQLDCQS